MEWLIIGLSGVSCGGKTTLATRLYEYFKDPSNRNALSSVCTIKTVKMVNQDNYFLPEDNQMHKWIPKLNHINWDIITALDMDQMCQDLNAIIGPHFSLHCRRDDDDEMATFSEINILIIEGFLVFSQPTIRQMCQIKFHVHVPYEVCFARRSGRVYNPPDVPGYFETCVWPMYQKYFKEFIDRQDVLMLNGETDRDKCFNYVLNCIKNTF